MNKQRWIQYGYRAACIWMAAAGLFLTARHCSSGAFCLLTAVTFLLAGAVRLAAYFSGDRFQLAYEFDFAMGLAAAAAGIWLLLKNGYTDTVCGYGAAMFLLADGLLHIQTAFEARRFGLSRWGLLLAVSVLQALFGFRFLLLLLQGEAAAFAVTGWSFLINGCSGLLFVSIAAEQQQRGRKEKR